jgi:hypothetical protein
LDNWSEMLPMAEYAYNNSVTLATAISPFYANYGYHPRTNWQTEAEAGNGWSQNYVNWISSIHELCKENLQKTHDRIGRYWNQGKKKPPKYEVGDLVMLKGQTSRLGGCPKSLIISYIDHSKWKR